MAKKDKPPLPATPQHGRDARDRAPRADPAPRDEAPRDEAPRDEALLTTRELMEFLNLSRTKIWELVTKQGLPAFKIGGDYRYRRSEVLAWLEKYRVRSEERGSR